MDVESMRKNALEASQLLKTLAHPERLMVLCHLTEGEMGASLLLERSALSQSAFSQHLSVLRKQGLVITRKDAQKVFYSLADLKTQKILETMHSLFCQEMDG